MKRTIHLHGPLADKFGGRFDLDVETPAEAVKALCVLRRGFRQDIQQRYLQVIRGPLDTGLDMDESALRAKLGDTQELHFVPVVGGAKDRGIGKVVAGVAIVGLSVAAAQPWAASGGLSAALGSEAALGVTYGNVAAFGVSVALSGAAQMLAPTPEANPVDSERPEEKPSFLFNGPVNVSEQGHPVPLIYGRTRVGSIVVSSGLEAEDLPT